MTIFLPILMLPLPVLLNRWRGTGAIITIGKFRLVGNIIYALYIAGIVGCVTALTDTMLPFVNLVINGIDTLYVFENSQLFSSFVFAFLCAGLYIAGESFAWGKWVGHLTHYEDEGKHDYNNDDGRSFPYIHYIAQAIVKQEKDYRIYCEVALTIRGFIWWTPLLILLGLINLISWYQVAFSSVALSVGFPIACYLGSILKIEYKSKYLNLSRGWENQEVVYGLFQFLCISFSILIYKVIL